MNQPGSDGVKGLHGRAAAICSVSVAPLHLCRATDLLQISLVRLLVCAGCGVAAEGQLRNEKKKRNTRGK